MFTSVQVNNYFTTTRWLTDHRNSKKKNRKNEKDVVTVAVWVGNKRQSQLFKCPLDLRPSTKDRGKAKAMPIHFISFYAIIIADCCSCCCYLLLMMMMVFSFFFFCLLLEFYVAAHVNHDCCWCIFIVIATKDCKSWGAVKNDN